MDLTTLASVINFWTLYSYDFLLKVEGEDVLCTRKASVSVRMRAKERTHTEEGFSGSGSVCMQTNLSIYLFT